MSGRDEITEIPRLPNNPSGSNKSGSTKDSSGTKKTPVSRKSNMNVEKTSDAGVRKEPKWNPTRKQSPFDRLVATARHEIEATRKTLETVGMTLSIAENYSVEDDEEALDNRKEYKDADKDVDEIQANTK